LFRYWLLIILGTLLGGMLAFGVTRFMTPVYRATAIQLVKGLPGSGAAANYEAAQFAVSRAKTYPSFVYSSTVLEGVRDDLGNRQSVVDLRKDLSVTNPVDTPLLEISATGTTATEARDKANSAARYLARFITEIETVGNRSPIIVETAVEAALPTDPASPKTVVISALGALTGFALACVVGLVNSYVRYQRRSAFQRRQPIGWIGDETDDMALATAVSSGVSPPESHPVMTSEPHATTASEPRAATATEAAATGLPVHPGRDGSTFVDGEHRSAISHSWPDELLFEVDPDPTTTLPRTEPPTVTAEDTDHTVERFGPPARAGSTNSAEPSDIHSIDPGEMVEPVEKVEPVEVVEPVEPVAVEPGEMVEPVDGDIEVAEPGDAADAATGSVDEPDGPDDSDALEHSGTGKQSVHQ
jgi:capsular polysaccharide biosynthesis protein